MADISKIKTIDGTVYNIKDTTARAQSGVTGVKGNAESSYRTGQVNLTAANVGATSTSVLPNDEGEIKTKFRIANKGYTGSGTPLWYYPLVKLPKDNSSNYASLIISGRIGGWVDNNMSYIQALIWNRGSTGIALMDIAGTATAMSAIWGICDIVAYTNSDDTDTVYLRAKSYFTYDLDIELYQSAATILYDGTYQTTTPSGTLNAQASTSTKRVELVNGKFLVAGTDLSVVSNLTGTLGVDHGGTGQTSATNAANAFLNSLTTGSSTPADADYYISQYVNGGTTTTTYHRRPMSALWEYVKGKISSVLGLTNTNYGGTSAKATADASGNTITSYYAPKSTAVTNVALATNKITKTINGTTTDVVTAATTSTYGITKLSTSTSSTATDVAATPSAVKTAYDLANTANTTANTALSGVNGNLIYDHTFSISNGIATFTPHVYQKGSEVTTNYNKSCFTWKYRKIDGTEVGLTTKNDRGCDVTITSMGYGGHVIGIFTPA